MSLPSPQEYQKMVEHCSPDSPLWKDTLLAFLIGGAICTVGQGFRHLFQSMALEPEAVGAATSIVMILLGALFTCLGLYDKLAKYGGAGTLVPITGFSNAVVSPAIEFRAEGIITGACAKMFAIAGPVIVWSAAAGILYGLILWVWG